MTMVGLGAIAGPVVGGFVVGGLGWRAVFFMTVPFGVISIVAASLILRSDKSSPDQPQKTASFDWVGASLSSSSLALFLLVLTNAYRVGWGSQSRGGGGGEAEGWRREANPGNRHEALDDAVGCRLDLRQLIETS